MFALFFFVSVYSFAGYVFVSACFVLWQMCSLRGHRARFCFQLARGNRRQLCANYCPLPRGHPEVAKNGRLGRWRCITHSLPSERLVAPSALLGICVGCAVHVFCVSRPATHVALASRVHVIYIYIYIHAHAHTHTCLLYTSPSPRD